MFCISLANQIHVIQRQPFFSIRPPHLPSIITFNRLTFCQKKKIFESNKNSANRPSRKGKKIIFRFAKKGIHNNETILDRNIFF